MKTAMRVVYAAGLAGLIHAASVTAAPAAYSVCAPADNVHRQHVVCGSAGCPRGETSVFSTDAVLPMCGGSSAAQAPASPAPASQASRSCGQHWSDWARPGLDVGNPCPSGCRKDSKVREESHGSGRRVERRELWRCAPR